MRQCTIMCTVIHLNLTLEQNLKSSHNLHITNFLEVTLLYCKIFKFIILSPHEEIKYVIANKIYMQSTHRVPCSDKISTINETSRIIIASDKIPKCKIPKNTQRVGQHSTNYARWKWGQFTKMFGTFPSNNFEHSLLQKQTCSNYSFTIYLLTYALSPIISPCMST